MSKHSHSKIARRAHSRWSRIFESLETRHLMSADAVLDWNAIALQAVANDHTPAIVASPEQGGPTRSARALGIVHAAIFDAVNAIDQSYTPYLVTTKVPKFVSIDAAASQAAHDTLVSLYPAQKAMFDAALRSSLADVPNGLSEFVGVALGKFVANKVLKARKDDGSQLMSMYIEGTQPGDHMVDPLHPTQGYLSPDWGQVKPFAMGLAQDFLAPPPPALTSAEYAASFNEVKNLGGDGVTTPTLRTPEQTEIGIYWGYDGVPGLGTPPRLYNQIARTIADQEDNTEVENARLFALINMSMADAACAAWDAKYVYEFWRPIIGIRQADPGTGPSGLGDGNPDTIGDPTWTPLGAPASNGAGTDFTPPFPAYTSGHATFGAAAFKSIANFYGRDDIAFSFTSDEFNGVTKGSDGVVRPVVTRSFDSLSEATAENAQSRIYLGVHWSFDAIEGINTGNDIADAVFASVLKPTSNGSSPVVIPPGVRPFLTNVVAGIRQALENALGGTLLVDPDHFRVGFSMVLASGSRQEPPFQLFAPITSESAATPAVAAANVALPAVTANTQQAVPSVTSTLAFGRRPTTIQPASNSHLDVVFARLGALGL